MFDGNQGGNADFDSSPGSILLSGFLCDKTVKQADFSQPAWHMVIYEGVMFT